MPYPSRPALAPLEEFRGSATVRQSPQQRRRLLEFARDQYAQGRSLREIAELTDRTQTAVRRALSQAGVTLRPPGAGRVPADGDDRQGVPCRPTPTVASINSQTA